MQLEIKVNGEQKFAVAGANQREQSHALVAFQHILEETMVKSGQQVVEFFSHGENKFVRFTKEEGKISEDVNTKRIEANTPEG